MNQHVMIEYIRRALPETELLAQLAEEAAELAQAALKVRRVIDGKNYSPVPLSVARESLDEEVNVVIVCLMALGYVAPQDRETESLVSSKLSRWFERMGGDPDEIP